MKKVMSICFILLTLLIISGCQKKTKNLDLYDKQDQNVIKQHFKYDTDNQTIIGLSPTGFSKNILFIPSFVTKIRSAAFSKIDAKEVYLKPNTTLEIESNVFTDNSNPITFHLTGIFTFHKWSFYKLVDATFNFKNAKVNLDDNNAIMGLVTIKEVNITESNILYNDNLLYIKDNQILHCNYASTDIKTILPETNILDGYAFWDKVLLMKQLTLPNVSVIGKYAITNALTLEKLTLGKLTKFEKNAIQRANLKAIVISDSNSYKVINNTLFKLEDNVLKTTLLTGQSTFNNLNCKVVITTSSSICNNALTIDVLSNLVNNPNLVEIENRAFIDQSNWSGKITINNSSLKTIGSEIFFGTNPYVFEAELLSLGNINKDWNKRL